jgi:trans-aconitate 2-methyltransferase
MEKSVAEWNAKDYASNSAAQQKWAQELLARIPLRGDERVLDIGCGDGKITALIAQKLVRGRVIGIDLSAEMIEFARSRFADHQPNLQFLQMDAQRIDLAEKFDLVFSNAALHWAPDQRAVLRGASAVMEAGASLIISCGGRGNAQLVSDVIHTLTERPQWRQWFDGWQWTYWFHSADEYRPWLIEAGLTPRRVELVNKQMVHAGVEQFAGWLRTTWFPYTDRVPEDQREQFVQAITQEYLTRRPPDSDGAVHVDMVRLEVEARKKPALV